MTQSKDSVAVSSSPGCSSHEPPPPTPYSSAIAQIIQSLGQLLVSVSRETLVIVMLFSCLGGVGFILYKQTEVVERNTAVMAEMKGILKQISDYHREHPGHD
jgi:hypothetical protein